MISTNLAWGDFMSEDDFPSLGNVKQQPKIVKTKETIVSKSSSDFEDGWKTAKVKERKITSGEKSVSKFHPCNYCSKPCIGLQCRDCHFNRRRKCDDCNKEHYAVQANGTINPRCNDCHKIYIQKRMKPCPCCGEKYLDVQKDGKVFDKCYKCFKASFSRCGTCDKKIMKGFSFCKECHCNNMKK
jgi:hypothetical protein